MNIYNAKDLIEQAAMLADIQNSDFISWKENMMFLDNAWADLYQQIINHGDKSFLQSFKFTGSSCILPDDFYQLYYICYSDGINRIPINRKSKTSTNEGPYYDIVGNELIIYNKMNSLRDIEVEYFPVRDSITYSADERTIDDDSTLPVKDCSDKYVLFSDGTVKSIIDSTTGTTVSGAVILADSIALAGTYFKGDNRLFSVSISGTTLTVKKYSHSAIYKTATIDGDIPTFSATVNAITDNGLYWTSSGTLKFFDFTTGKTTDYDTGLTDGRVYSFHNNVYYEKGDGVYVDGKLLISSKDYGTFQGVMKVDERTGYGILFDRFVIKSAFANTEFDYPNNFYYNYMAYKLAVYYKIKQGADATSINALAQDALKTFYDTLPRDENEFVRISNVYAR